MNMDGPSKTAGAHVVAFADKPVMVPGRRDFLQYRELGVTKASGGRIRAQVTSAT